MMDGTMLASVFLLGLGVGVVFGWLATSLRTQKRISELSTTLEIERTKNDGLVQTFEALSDKALRQNNHAFFELANAKLEPLQKSLEQFDSKLQEVEKQRVGAYAGVTQQISNLLSAQNELRSETASLVGALKTPRIRGRWGEIQLKRVVEIAGMLDHCDFFEQQSGDGPLRPDMIIELPYGRTIVIDAKVPLDSYLMAMEAKDDDTRKAKLIEHVRQIRKHMSQLSGKSYWDQFPSAPEFVFMFLPGESFYSAALQQDPSLIEDAVNQRVIIATPVTLITLLRAVEFGWRQKRLDENAKQIGNLGKELYERICKMGDHFAHLGSKLRGAVDSYNDAVGSLEARVLVSARRFKELGVAGATKEIETVESIEVVPRKMQASEVHQMWEASPRETKLRNASLNAEQSDRNLMGDAP
jgi:DNA recombination protein RmuC